MSIFKKTIFLIVLTALKNLTATSEIAPPVENTDQKASNDKESLIIRSLNSAAKGLAYAAEQVQKNPLLKKSIIFPVRCLHPILSKSFNAASPHMGWFKKSCFGLSIFGTEKLLELLTGTGSGLATDASRMMGSEKLPLGDDQSFFRAKRIDSLEAVPAVIEVLLPSFASTLAVELLNVPDKKSADATPAPVEMPDLFDNNAIEKFQNNLQQAELLPEIKQPAPLGGGALATAAALFNPEKKIAEAAQLEKIMQEFEKKAPVADKKNYENGFKDFLQENQSRKIINPAKYLPLWLVRRAPANWLGDPEKLRLAKDAVDRDGSQARRKDYWDGWRKAFTKGNPAELFTVKDAKLSDRLRNSNLFKADVLLAAKYLKWFAQDVVKNRIFKFTDPKVYAAFYKKSLGFIDHDVFSFASSLGMVQLLTRPETKDYVNRVINLTNGDQHLVKNLVGSKNADFLLKDRVIVDHLMQTSGAKSSNLLLNQPFVARTIEQSIVRFALQKVCARAIFFALRGIEKGVGAAFGKLGFMRNTFDNYLSATDEGKKCFRLNLAKILPIPVVPFVVEFSIGGLKVFKTQTVDGQIIHEAYNLDEFFDLLAELLNEPTLRIPSERSQFFTKWLSEILASAIVAPLVENLLAQQFDRQGRCLEERSLLGNAGLFKLIPALGIAVAWAAFAGAKGTMTAKLKNKSA